MFLLQTWRMFFPSANPQFLLFFFNGKWRRGLLVLLDQTAELLLTPGFRGNLLLFLTDGDRGLMYVYMGK